MLPIEHQPVSSTSVACGNRREERAAGLTALLAKFPINFV